ncbi:hypothetical protein [Streptomyces canus]|uniref:hypothetical protein n=1 Tax=Streptomyces canus TaxID=58343 RepID=UPI0027D8E95E|nr:hypothetical protein [Streptomyces canus]
MVSVDNQSILQVLADRRRFHQGPLTCQEIAAWSGMNLMAAEAEALQSKANRLIARGIQRPGQLAVDSRAVSKSSSSSSFSFTSALSCSSRTIHC